MTQHHVREALHDFRRALAQLYVMVIIDTAQELTPESAQSATKLIQELGLTADEIGYLSQLLRDGAPAMPAPWLPKPDTEL